MRTAFRPDMRSLSIRVFFAGTWSFGVSAEQLHGILDLRSFERVPLAPVFIAGAIPCRGEILTVVSLRALLGLAENREGCVLVLRDKEGKERFGLKMDEDGGALLLSRALYEPRPEPMDVRLRGLFDGAWRTTNRWVARLDPEGVAPRRLAEAAELRAGEEGRV